MLSAEDIRSLYGFNAWANQRARETGARLSPEQFTRDMGSSFGSVRDTMVHIFAAEWIWVARWLGRTPEKFPKAADFPDFASVERRWLEIEREQMAYVASLKPEDLGRVVHYVNMSGEKQESPIWQMLQHVVNHGTYHRGQLVTMLRQLGATPNSADLLQYYRSQAAKTKSA